MRLSCSRSFKVIDFSTNRKRVIVTLLVPSRTVSDIDDDDDDDDDERMYFNVV